MLPVAAAVKRTEQSSSSPMMAPVASFVVRALSPKHGRDDATTLESASERGGYAGTRIGDAYTPHDEMMMSMPTSVGGTGLGGAGQFADLEHYCHHSSLLLSSTGIDDGLQQCDDGLKLTTHSSVTPRQPLHQHYSSVSATIPSSSIPRQREFPKPAAGHDNSANQTRAQQQYADGHPSTPSGTAAVHPDPHVSPIGHPPVNAFNFPSFLPPPPKLKSANPPPPSAFSDIRPIVADAPATDSDMFDFAQMSANYLDMLQSKPEDNQDGSPQVSYPGLPEIPFQYSRPNGGDSRGNISHHDVMWSADYSSPPSSPLSSCSPVSSGNDMQVSPMFSSPHEEFLTSPLLEDGFRDFMSPDLDTPFSTFLSTPDLGASTSLPPMSIANSDDNAYLGLPGGSDGHNMPFSNHPAAFAYDSTSPLIPFDDSYSGLSLLDAPEQLVHGEHGTVDYKKGLLPKHPAPTLNSQRRTLAPAALSSSSTSPATTPGSRISDTIPNSNQLYTMSPVVEDLDEFPAPQRRGAQSPSIPSRRQPRGAAAKYTGTRRNVTPSTLIPDDAPIQRRQYGGASNTSKRTSKKRTASEAFDPSTLTNEEELEAAREQGLLSQPDYKRIQNTLAARKSRKRKLQYQIDLEDQIELMSKERDLWKDRALMLAGMLKAQGTEVQFDD